MQPFKRCDTRFTPVCCKKVTVLAGRDIRSLLSLLRRVLINDIADKIREAICAVLCAVVYRDVAFLMNDNGDSVV